MMDIETAYETLDISSKFIRLIAREDFLKLRLMNINLERTPKERAEEIFGQKNMWSYFVSLSRFRPGAL
jgi:hypothetical protein